MSVPYLAQAADHEQLQWLGGGVMRITPASMAAAAVATGQRILGPPLTADQMIPAAYRSGQQAR